MNIFQQGQERVVVTGLGWVTPLGANVLSTWGNLLAGQSGAMLVPELVEAGLPVTRAAVVAKWQPSEQIISAKNRKRWSRTSQFAAVAAWEAWDDAGLSTAQINPTNVAGWLGVAKEDVAGVRLVMDAVRAESSRVPVVQGLEALSNMPLFHIFEVLGLAGAEGYTITAACAAGNVAIHRAASQIRQGEVTVAIAGGADALISELMVVVFNALGVLTPTVARPFDRNRDGFMLGEGAAILVLESLSHALARDARIYAEIIGGGVATDTHSIAIPRPGGRVLGVVLWKALKQAERVAGIELADVQLVIPHGSGTKAGDAVEDAVLRRVFGAHAPRLMVPSVKSMLGHPMAPAGADATIAAILAMQDGIVPATINLVESDPECDLDHVPNYSQPAEVRVAVTLAAGLGDQYAATVIKHWNGNG